MVEDFFSYHNAFLLLSIGDRETTIYVKDQIRRK